MTLEQITALGLKAIPFGKGWNIVGRNVDVLVSSLHRLMPGDVQPVKSNYDKESRR